MLWRTGVHLRPHIPLSDTIKSKQLKDLLNSLPIVRKSYVVCLVSEQTLNTSSLAINQCSVTWGTESSLAFLLTSGAVAYRFVYWFTNYLLGCSVFFLPKKDPTILPAIFYMLCERRVLRGIKLLRTRSVVVFPPGLSSRGCGPHPPNSHHCRAWCSGDAHSRVDVWESEGRQAEAETHMFPVYPCDSSYSEFI